MLERTLGPKKKEKEKEERVEKEKEKEKDEEINIGATPIFSTPASSVPHGPSSSSSTPSSPFISTTTTTTTTTPLPSSVSEQDALNTTNPDKGRSRAPEKSSLQGKDDKPSADAEGKAGNALDKLAALMKGNPALVLNGEPLNIDQMRDIFRQELEEEKARKVTSPPQGEEPTVSEEEEDPFSPTDNNTNNNVDNSEGDHNNNLVDSSGSKSTSQQISLTNETLTAVITAALIAARNDTNIMSGSSQLIESRILADSGSDLDLISAAFADTLGLRRQTLDVPHTVDGFTQSFKCCCRTNGN